MKISSSSNCLVFIQFRDSLDGGTQDTDYDT